MACGKSSYGRKAANRLDLPFIDLDNTIEKSHGMTISELFQKQGEVKFRAIEKEILQSILPQPGIISLGGGTVCNPEVWPLLKSNGITVFLDMPFEQCLGRIRTSKNLGHLLQTSGAWKESTSCELSMKRAKTPIIALTTS